jgi:hypothetical protein
MRALFLLLVLANLVLFTYAHLARGRGGLESQIPLLQISPEKIKLLGTGGGTEPGRPRAPVKTATVAPTVCLEWGIFAGPNVARAESALAQLELTEASITRTVTDAGGYWVYIPPLKTKADIDRKIGELKALGVTEFFVVQDPSQWRNAVSLGIFKSDEAAQAFLANLRKRGVRSAVTERREDLLKQIAFFVREPDQATVVKLTELQREFSGSELKAAPCPDAAAEKG